ncbi:SDR family NAD(P)-dependent oxidoreductase [Vibrio sp. S11_S32]|uniref:SDR family NAD(P)-dependent oxidoreductase n=1 Tax=Vibrio sp. S11_S32 TaxID=2720225 RepID=UPI001EEF50A4|nr:SDR family oxidoreductase [Vibrio sp. S11_S32]
MDNIRGNKVVVISGGSKGLGITLVKKYLLEGYSVATFSRNSNAEIESNLNNKKFYWQKVDSENILDLKTFVKSVKNRFGKIDILINNAAYLTEGLLTLTSNKDINKSIMVNLISPIQLINLCLPSMLKNKDGSIINIASINSVRGHKGVSVYSATKTGLIGLSNSLAKELAPSNIRVNCVSPGFFETDLVSYLDDERRKQILKRIPLGRIATVNDISGVVFFMTSIDAAFITGQNIIIDGGMTC